MTGMVVMRNRDTVVDKENRELGSVDEDGVEEKVKRLAHGTRGYTISRAKISSI